VAAVCGAAAANSFKYTTTTTRTDPLTPSTDPDPNRYRNVTPDPNLNEFASGAPQTPPADNDQ